MPRTPTWEPICGATGPPLRDTGFEGAPASLHDEGGDGELEITCERGAQHNKSKDLADRAHRWTNDEGDVQISWVGEPPFNFGSGSWRTESETQDRRAYDDMELP